MLRLRMFAGHLLARPAADDDGEWDEDDEGIATLDGNRMLAVRAEAGEDGDLDLIGWDEIVQHNTREDLWVVVDGTVYDMTVRPQPPAP